MKLAKFKQGSLYDIISFQMINVKVECKLVI